jgi:hypothetical protein
MKIAVSSCLLGINCKYNGKSNYNEDIIKLKEKYELIPICPEVLGGLPTPRIPSEIINEKLLVITSTEHLYRTIRCLKKVGFENIVGIPAQEATVDFNLSLENQKLGGNSSIPSVGNTKIRYTFYNYLKLEIICVREYIAITYYKIKDWI